MASIVVLDYGSNNLHSVAKALEHVAEKNHRIIISDDAKVIRSADRVVFPGQGAIRQCMQNLANKSLDKLIVECIQNKPFLGICLGLQSLLQYSEEDGGTDGLGIIKGKVKRFKDGAKESNGQICKIPHMGWNKVNQAKPHALWNDISNNERFYFVHSYYVAPDEYEDVAGTTEYANNFASAVARDNFFATQFHPEKSQHAGLTLLKNFLDWNI